MGIELRSSLEPRHVRDLHALFQGEWWTKGRGLSEVECLVAKAQYLFALVESETETLAGFARVLTDHVYKAFVFDVIVAPNYRGRGLGDRLVEAIIAHPDIRRVHHLELYCLPDMFEFYRRFGFSEKLGRLRLMRLSQRES